MAQTTQKTELLEAALSMILPPIIYDHFILEAVEQDEFQIVFHMVEDNKVLQPIEGHTYKPNGFYEASTIQDFPIRDKKTLFIIKRRRWIDETTGEGYHNAYDLAENGTRYSKEFAIFLKDTI